MKHWVEVAGVDDIPRLQARLVKTGYHKLAVFRTASDEIFAVEDACPHKFGALSQGVVHDNMVTCPCHNLDIDLASGKLLGFDHEYAKTFPTRVKSGRIYLSL